MLLHEWQRAIIGVIILVLGVPLGILLTNMAKDELRDGRKWFFALMIISVVGITFFFLNKNIPLTLIFEFILVISAISYWKSFK